MTCIATSQPRPDALPDVRAAGYAIGSGAVESAVSHVVQQRMKRVGMRWRSAGADAMLALRSIYRSTGAWDQFWACRRVA